MGNRRRKDTGHASFSDICNMVTDVVREAKIPMLMDSIVCIVWQTENEFCDGCPSEVECYKWRKLVTVYTINLVSNSHDRIWLRRHGLRSYSDRIDRIEELVEWILAAESLDEIDDIPDQ